MENPIKYEDLFNPDVKQNLDSLLQTLRGIQESFANLLNTAKTSAASMQQSMQGTTTATNEGRRAAESQAASIEQVYEAYRKMGIEYKEITSQMQTLLGAKRAVTLTQKEMNKVVQIGNQYNRERENTYAALSQKYSALKILINQMTVSEREQTEVGRLLVAQAREIYEQMNVLQQQTGKYTLQVGNYSKAMTGLNIATQQVIRELPVITNGWSMFAIAISNNIPILLDNIQAVQRQNELLGKQKEELMATGNVTEAMAIKTTSVGKALLSSIFSWQTAIVLLLTVLPNLIRNIEKKRKAQKELNDETKVAITYTNIMAKAEKEAHTQQTRSISKLQTLYKITQDSNRSWEDRIAVSQQLKRDYEEELEMFTAEEIALGKAKGAIRNLTASLVEQAQARAYLSEIESLTIQHYDLEKKKIKELSKVKELETELAIALAEKELAARQAIMDVNMYGETSNATAAELNRTTNRVSRLSREIESAKVASSSFDRQMQDIENGIDSIINKIKVGGLIDWTPEEDDPIEDDPIRVFPSGGRSGSSPEQKDFFNEYFKGILEQIENPLTREKLLAAFEFDTQIEAYEKYLEQQRALSAEDREINEAQEKYIEGIIVNLEKQKWEKINKIDQEYAEERNSIVTDAASQLEEDLEEENERIEEEIEQQFLDEVAALDTALRIADDYVIANNKNRHRRQQEFLRNEAEYWKAYRAILIANGKWSASFEEEYKQRMEALKQQQVEETPDTFMGWIGFAANEEYARNFESNISKAFDTAFSYMDEWMDKRMQMAEAAVEAARKESEAALSALETEQLARANGYANNVEWARKEYEEKLALEREAMAEQQRLAKIQQGIDDAQQISSLLVATANIWAAYTKGNVFGAVLAGIATAAMWGSFAAAKIQASNLVKTKNYGEGMSEYLDYGGSHASGNDIDFGVMRDGTRRRVERGEMIAVINKRNVGKYGVGEVSNIISALNTGTFEDKYGLAFSGLGVTTSGADLSRVEQGIDALVSQGEKRVVVAGGKTIEYYKNTKRVIIN